MYAILLFRFSRNIRTAASTVCYMKFLRFQVKQMCMDAPYSFSPDAGGCCQPEVSAAKLRRKRNARKGISLLSDRDFPMLSGISPVGCRIGSSIPWCKDTESRGKHQEENQLFSFLFGAISSTRRGSGCLPAPFPAWHGRCLSL